MSYLTVLISPLNLEMSYLRPRDRFLKRGSLLYRNSELFRSYPQRNPVGGLVVNLYCTHAPILLHTYRTHIKIKDGAVASSSCGEDFYHTRVSPCADCVASFHATPPCWKSIPNSHNTHGTTIIHIVDSDCSKVMSKVSVDERFM